MQRKPTKNTRGPNAEESRFQAWLKDQPCIATGTLGPSIVHHCHGSCFRHNKVLVGHWFCIPLSKQADDIVTFGSRRAFRERYGAQSYLWELVMLDYAAEKDIAPPEEVYDAIMDWGR